MRHLNESGGSTDPDQLGIERRWRDRLNVATIYRRLRIIIFVIIREKSGIFTVIL